MDRPIVVTEAAQLLCAKYFYIKADICYPVTNIKVRGECGFLFHLLWLFVIIYLKILTQRTQRGKRGELK
jgi:hypothetical protein